MFDDNFGKPVTLESPIKIGRIAFCIVLVLPIWIFGYLLISPGHGDELKELGMLLAIVMLFFSFILSIVGTIAFVVVRRNGQPQLFWGVATSIAAVPLIFSVFAAIFVNIIK